MSLNRSTLPPDYLRTVSRLYGDDADARIRHYAALTQSEQETAIRQLARDGQQEHTIARATGLAVEQVRRIVGADGGGEAR